MKIIIVGCGNVGITLVEQLSKEGHDITIIDEKDLNNQINYIHYNPVKHGYAKSVKDWKYSSFHKFVKNKFYDINWGSNTDIKEIIDLDFE